MKRRKFLNRSASMVSGLILAQNSRRIPSFGVERGPGHTKEKLLWGDLHCHSIFGDGIRAPEELHTFARDETFLDFYALTDHTEILSDGQWEYFKY